MIIKSKAPFRIGLAGGGTDVEPYVSKYGGEVVNATVGLYARTSLEITEDQLVYFEFKGLAPAEYDMATTLPYRGDATDLITATYNRFSKDHGIPFQGLMVQVDTEVPIGSGLGTSSTIVVSLCGAFLRAYGLEWDRAMIAEYAFDIEREDLGWAGGKQDQYAAAYGGFNHIIFPGKAEAMVERLRVRPEMVSMLEQSMILFHTRQQRHSAGIIEEQQRYIGEDKEIETAATHQLKQMARDMADVLKQGEPRSMGPLLNRGFLYKKQIASGVTNPAIEKICEKALQAGAEAAKISGAGGGGFILFFVPPSKRNAVQQALTTFEGQEYPFHFTDRGLTTWTE